MDNRTILTGHRRDQQASSAVDLSRHSFSDTGVERKSSGVVSSLQAINDIVVGKKLANGIILTFSSGTPSIHIRNTAVKEILKDVRSYASTFAECIERYTLVSGLAPSKRGFEVMALVLKKLSPKEGDVRRELKQVCDEALAIDLSSPRNPDWKREVSMPIAGVDTRITVSLARLSALRRFGARAFHTDLPLDERSHRYGYKLEMKPEQSSGSAVLRGIGGRVRQAVALMGLYSPMVFTMYAMINTSIADCMPQISTNPQVQNAVSGIMNWLVVAGVGAISRYAHEYLINRKIMGRSHP